MRKHLTAGNKGEKAREETGWQGKTVLCGRGFDRLAGGTEVSQGSTLSAPWSASQLTTAEWGCSLAGASGLGAGAAIGGSSLQSRSTRRTAATRAVERWGRHVPVRHARCAKPPPQPAHDNLPAVPSVMSVITAGTRAGGR